MQSPRPIGMHIPRPYHTEEDFIRGDGLAIGRLGMILIGAPARPPGMTIRFEIALDSGEIVFRGEGRVVAHRVHANGRQGLEVRFTRLDSQSKSLVENVLKLRRSGALTPASADPMSGPATASADPFHSDAPQPHDAASTPASPSRESAAPPARGLASAAAPPARQSAGRNAASRHPATVRRLSAPPPPPVPPWPSEPPPAAESSHQTPTVPAPDAEDINGVPAESSHQTPTVPAPDAEDINGVPEVEPELVLDVLETAERPRTHAPTVPHAPQPQAAPQALPAVAPPTRASRTDFDDRPLKEQDIALAEQEPKPFSPISLDEIEEAIALLRPITLPAPKPTGEQPAPALDEARPATEDQPNAVARAVRQTLPSTEDLSDTATMPVFEELPDMPQPVDEAQVAETQPHDEPAPHLAPRTMPQPGAAPRRQLLAVGAPDQPPSDKPQVAAMLAKLRGRSSQFERPEGTRDALSRLRARLRSS